MDDETPTRDKAGRFVPGHKCASPGRPPAPKEQKMHDALLDAVATNGALKEGAAKIADRIRKGDLRAWAFVWDRLIGAPKQSVDMQQNGEMRIVVEYIDGQDTAAPAAPGPAGNST